MILMQKVMRMNRVKQRARCDERKPLLNRKGAAVVAVAVYCCLNGCVRQDEPHSLPFSTDFFGLFRSPDDSLMSSSLREMPEWLDLYREKKLVNVSTVDQVVIVTFETFGNRDDVYRHYSEKFGGEENFISFRDSRDIISFIRDGFGVKITLLDQARNLWTLEYHHRAI